LVLSLVWRAWPSFPQNLALVHLLSATMLAGAAGILVSLGRRLDIPLGVVCAAVVLAFTAPGFLRIAAVPSAEPLLLLVATAAISFAARGGDWAPSALLAGCCVGATGLTVTWGGLLIPALAIGLAVSRTWRSGALCLGAGLAVLAVGRKVFWGVVLASSSPNLANGDVPVVSGAVAMGGVPALLGALAVGLLTVVTSLAILGAVTVARREPGLVAAVGLVVLGPPFGIHTTKWIGLPWLLLIAATGVVWLWRRVPRVRAPAGVLAAVAIGLYLVVVWQGEVFGPEVHEASDAYRVVVSSVRGETPSTAVIAARRDALVSLYSGRGRRTLWYDESRSNHAGLVRDLCRRGATHVLAESRWPDNLDAGPASAVSIFRLTQGPALYRLECAAIEEVNEGVG
jgi:hypothetical protein